ncbi:hypothetical protein F5884DRAFT_859566 [Xylogone sp. PMI_703]|nr:hypothetical protein F5884DRAFT_859566 [Xylogone sp. PMI_703]
MENQESGPTTNVGKQKKVRQGHIHKVDGVEYLLKRGKDAAHRKYLREELERRLAKGLRYDNLLSIKAQPQPPCSQGPSSAPRSRSPRQSSEHSYRPSQYRQEHGHRQDGEENRRYEEYREQKRPRDEQYERCRPQDYHRDEYAHRYSSPRQYPLRDEQYDSYSRPRHSWPREGPRQDDGYYSQRRPYYQDDWPSPQQYSRQDYGRYYNECNRRDTRRDIPTRPQGRTSTTNSGLPTAKTVSTVDADKHIIDNAYQLANEATHEPSSPSSPPHETHTTHEINPEPAIDNESADASAGNESDPAMINEVSNEPATETMPAPEEAVESSHETDVIAPIELEDEPIITAIEELTRVPAPETSANSTCPSPSSPHGIEIETDIPSSSQDNTVESIKVYDSDLTDKEWVTSMLPTVEHVIELMTGDCTWLDDDTLRAILCMMIEHSGHHLVEPELRDIGIAGALCSPHFLHFNPKERATCLIPALKAGQRTLIALHVGGNHWQLVDFERRSGLVTVFDSMAGLSDTEAATNLMSALSNAFNLGWTGTINLLQFGPSDGWSCGYAIVKVIDSYLRDGRAPDYFSDPEGYRSELLPEVTNWLLRRTMPGDVDNSLPVLLKDMPEVSRDTNGNLSIDTSSESDSQSENGTESSSESDLDSEFDSDSESEHEQNPDYHQDIEQEYTGGKILPGINHLRVVSKAARKQFDKEHARLAYGKMTRGEYSKLAFDGHARERMCKWAWKRLSLWIDNPEEEYGLQAVNKDQTNLSDLSNRCLTSYECKRIQRGRRCKPPKHPYCKTHMLRKIMLASGRLTPWEWEKMKTWKYLTCATMGNQAAVTHAIWSLSMLPRTITAGVASIRARVYREAPAKYTSHILAYCSIMTRTGNRS